LIDRVLDPIEQFVLDFCLMGQDLPCGWFVPERFVVKKESLAVLHLALDWFTCPEIGFGGGQCETQHSQVDPQRPSPRPSRDSFGAHTGGGERQGSPHEWGCGAWD
jgi:hypothetical protein